LFLEVLIEKHKEFRRCIIYSTDFMSTEADTSEVSRVLP
jgi:hypothetical protein